jgi:glucans biosynthesis protein C
MVGLPGGLDSIVGGFNIKAFAYAVWEPFLAIGISILLLASFKKYVNIENGFTRWLTSNAYTVYIIHPVMLVSYSVIMANVSLPIYFKFLTVGAASILTCWIVSSLVRKIPYVKTFL